MTDQEKTRDEAIRQALGELPGINASPHFTAQLVARASQLESPARSRPARWRLAVAAGVVASLAGGFYAQKQIHRRQVVRQREALVQRQVELRQELEQLRAQVANSPTLYLGTSRDVDVVLDLEPWMQQTNVRPASYTPDRQ